jgi:hypothetical protein
MSGNQTHDSLMVKVDANSTIIRYLPLRPNLLNGYARVFDWQHVCYSWWTCFSADNRQWTVNVLSVYLFLFICVFSIVEYYHVPTSNLTSIIDYIHNTVIKLPIYFTSHIRIEEQIINIIPKWFHVFIQVRGAYIYCFLTELSGKNT